ncbi:MAG: EAL domain-containing protein [Ilumatobacteraceae bacterium]
MKTLQITIEQVIETGSITSAYQPIVDIDSGQVVAYEALARGPLDTSLEHPDQLFAAAGAAGLTAELDWACRASAVRGALEAGLGSAAKLFINVEPSTLRTPVPSELEKLMDMATSALSIVVEVTERSLVSDPAALIGALSWIRTAGMGVAIDDVGADPASLALLPFIEPDVIKLDMSLVRQHTYDEIASISGAVRADAERRAATTSPRESRPENTSTVHWCWAPASVRVGCSADRAGSCRNRSTSTRTPIASTT